jgi:hypothetical protein
LFRHVNLVRPVHLVCSDKVIDGLWRRRQDHPGLPGSLDELVADLNARRDGLPATLSPPQQGGKDWSMLLYGSSFVARLFETNSGTGYMIGGIEPIRIRNHDQLARGCLLLRTPRWQLDMTIRHIPRGADSQWPRLGAEWQSLQESLAVPRAAEPVTTAQAVFLDRVSRMIDAERTITTELARREPPYPYRDVQPAAGSRHGTRPVYRFRTAGNRVPGEGTFVQVRGEPEQRGQVTFVDGPWVTVRFDQRVDWDRITKTGELEATPSTVVYDKQREAVTLLRDRQAANTDLLAAVVDHRVHPIPARSDEPTIELDQEHQLKAFRKALAVQDLLLVLGPPGTGKTRVISQIAEATAADGARQRVLVASHTNRAVDNVLGRLPRGVLAIRVGNEGAVTDEGQPYLLERQVTELRKQILGRTGRELRCYQDIDLGARWAAEFADRMDSLTASIDDESRAREGCLAARRAVGGPAQRRVDELASLHRGQTRRLARAERRTDRLSRWQAKTLSWGPRATALAHWCGRRLSVACAKRDARRAAVRQTGKDLVVAEQELDTLTQDFPQVRTARAAMTEATHLVEKHRKATLLAAHTCRAVFTAIELPPEVRDDTDFDVLRRDLRTLRDWLTARLPVLRARATLLREWHDAVESATDQLHTELVRYADVIAATCIGAASRSELSAVDFDLAIVDEAGQIGIANLLVPLVRARRGVLVGDHQQLPPYLDSDVEKWGKSVNDPIIRELLTKSGFELLVDALPATNVVPLFQQRRMPATVAEFISKSFYDNRLTTAVNREHHDSVFHSPMAFVDTARLPEQERRERPDGNGEKWGRSGYVNPAEARLLAGLAAFYHRRHDEWAVIVPYRAQVDAIVTLLNGLVAEPEIVKLNVGTVDSFQGGERDVILYGFTRSNPTGKVGFLDELRRANVALTRVKHQLVLVGDMNTLTRAQDREFRTLAESLRDHLAAKGDIRQYRDIEAVIGR